MRDYLRSFSWWKGIQQKLWLEWQYTAGRSPQYQPPKPLIIIWSSSGFSHLQPGVFHISLRSHKTTTYTTERVERKENKQTRTWFSSKHKKSKVCNTFLAFCELSRACIRAKFPQIHPRMLTCPLTSAFWVHRPSTVLSFAVCPVLSTGLFCLLLLFCSETFLPSSSSGLMRASHAQALCVGFAPKQTKGSSDWHPHRHTQKRMPPIVSHWIGKVIQLKFYHDDKWYMHKPKSVFKRRIKFLVFLKLYANEWKSRNLGEEWWPSWPQHCSRDLRRLTVTQALVRTTN